MENVVSGSFLSTEQNEAFDASELFGSLDPEELPYGLVMFERDGTVSSLCAPEEVIGKHEAASVTIAMDFIHYAFDRGDWMAEFIADVHSKKKESALNEETGPKLTLIKGGLEENE